MFLDIALGMLAGLVVGAGFNLEFVWLFILLGAIFALLPDFDFLVMLARRGLARDRRFDHDHRDLLHKPLIYIPVGAAAAFGIGGAPLATLFTSGSVIHFLHDSTGIGWGIRWLYPFSDNYIGICHAGLRKICGAKWIQSVSRKQVTKHVKETLGDDHDWIADLYLRISKTLVIEIFVLTIAIASTFYFLN